MSMQKRALWTALFLIFFVSIAGAAATWWQNRDVTRLIDGHVLASMQLTGAAGAMQLPKADLAGVFNMGGAAVANYVSVLERAR